MAWISRFSLWRKAIAFPQKVLRQILYRGVLCHCATAALKPSEYPIMPALSNAQACGPRVGPLSLRAMTGSGKSGDRKRAERLAAALRDNLKRRKTQAKARSQAVAKGRQHDSAGIAHGIAEHKPKG